MACNKLKRTIRAGHICINTHNTTRIRAFVSGTPQAWSRSGKGAWFFFRTKAEVRPCPLGRLLETGGGLVYSVRLSERRPLTTSRQLVGAPSLRRPPPPPPIYRSRSSFFLSPVVVGRPWSMTPIHVQGISAIAFLFFFFFHRFLSPSALALQ